jgi:predicted site-specific integrase-resolvase
MSWVKAKQAKEYYSITSPTLRHWAKIKKIGSQQLPSGRYKYWIEDYQKKGNKSKTGKHTIIYARVSSSKQSQDLKRQEKYLKTKYPTAELKSDIGSGLNYKRTGFRAILQSLFKGNIKEVVVAHKDRFTRFGFEFFEWLFNQFGAVITSLENEEYTEGTGDDLTDDLMSVITVFTARYYGSRKYKETKNNEKGINKGRKKRIRNISNTKS